MCLIYFCPEDRDRESTAEQKSGAACCKACDSRAGRVPCRADISIAGPGHPERKEKSPGALPKLCIGRVYTSEMWQAIRCTCRGDSSSS